ncbi:MAG TPA: DUF192 domain-containing protein [Bdellovibrionota bacterium]|nr:DUF192 domain-containing protein [Bdellovibrionota bacterium]
MLAIALFAAFSLPQSLIQIGRERLTVEIANTEESRRTGLMGRKHLPQGHGMLFVFDREDFLSFWMKDTLIPLSIAFFDREKNLIEILDMPVAKTNLPPLFKSASPARYALEVPKGWFEEHDINSHLADLKFSFLDREDRVK